MSAKEFDFIILGANGFTGKIVVKHSVKLLSKYNWAISGRDQTKLENILQEVGKELDRDISNIKIIKVDTTELSLIENLTKQCKVLINCIGPYQPSIGEMCVKACINTGTHQIDIAAEDIYIERLIQNFNEEAQAKNVYIVSGCGFGGLIADLGVVFLQDQFKSKTINYVEQYLTTSLLSQRGTVFNAGTLTSIVHTIKFRIREKEEAENWKKLVYKDYPTSLVPEIPKHGFIHRAHSMYCVPFISADNSVVKLTQNYFHKTYQRRPVQFKSYYGVTNVFQLFLLIIFGIILGLSVYCSCVLYLFLTFPYCFTVGKVTQKGPTSKEMGKTKFSYDLYGVECPSTGISEDAHVRISGSDGYKFTAIAMILSALKTLENTEQLPSTGGAFTPGAAFAKTDLIEQLREHGYPFEVVE